MCIFNLQGSHRITSLDDKMHQYSLRERFDMEFNRIAIASISETLISLRCE